MAAVYTLRQILHGGGAGYGKLAANNVAMRRPMAKAKKQSFEESLAELEAIVERMESGELSLEASLEAFENGMKLSRDAQAALSAAELKVQKLTEQQGALHLEEFDPEV